MSFPHKPILNALVGALANKLTALHLIKLLFCKKRYLNDFFTWAISFSFLERRNSEMRSDKSGDEIALNEQSVIFI